MHIDDPSSSYIFDYGRTEEARRLQDQAELIAPITSRLLLSAGLREGMSVLDLGCGVGDVAMLASRIVGPSGKVVGLDSAQHALAVAERRVQDANLKNVTFVLGNVDSLQESLGPPAESFDAVIGRFILQFLPDPPRTIAAASKYVAPGGIVCFQEVDDWYTWSYPNTELWERARRTFLVALEATGVEQRMGLRLFQAFRNSGLGEPQLNLEAAIGGGVLAPTLIWAGVVGGVLPALADLGLSTEQLDGASLLEELSAEVARCDSVVIGPPLIGAWIRKSGSAGQGSEAPKTVSA